MSNPWQNAIQSIGNKPTGGVGNVPYAPGVMSGQLSGQQPQQSSGGIQQMYANVGRSQGMSNARSGMSQILSGGQPAPNGGGIQWTPEIQQHVMQYLMSVIRSTNPGDQLSSTGGITNRA